MSKKDVEELRQLYIDYLELPTNQKRQFEAQVDVKKLKDLLVAEGAVLPQTNGIAQSYIQLLGLLLVAMSIALLFNRRRTQQDNL